MVRSAPKISIFAADWSEERTTMCSFGLSSRAANTTKTL
jgi:hypothetical protein